MIVHKLEKINGESVLFIKWQNDDEDPSIKMMAHINGVYAESDIGFDDEVKRDNCYEKLTQEAAGNFIDLARSASGQ